MGRYSYIPLEFENLSSGLEREIVLDYANNDLYVLDDYKIPVSATKGLREEINDLDEESGNLLEKSEELLDDYLNQKDRIIEEKDRLDDMIDKMENNFVKRINGLDSYNEYLKGFYTEVKASFDEFMKSIEDTVNNYFNDLDAILESVRVKYEMSLDLYNKYVEYKNNYEEVVTQVEEDIKVLKEKLPLKLKNLGQGSGSWDGEVETDGTVIKRATTSFRWMSNNSTHYPGDIIADNMDGYETAWFKYISPAPHVPPTFVDDNPTVSNIFDFQGPPGDENKYLVRSYWRDGNDTPAEHGDFVSDTGYRNSYAKWAVCDYEKEFGEKVKKPVHIEI